MREELRHVVERTPWTNIYVGDHWERELRAELEALEEEPSPERFLAIGRLAQAELNLGREQEALQLFTEAYRMIPEVEYRLEKNVVDQLVFLVGLAWLRHGETENCARRHNPERCVLPIQGQGVHSIVEGSQRAVELFTEVLERTPPGSAMHLQALWLLNIAAMTLGDYPDGVPVGRRIPPEALVSDLPFPRFRNIAAELGLDTLSLSGGAVADDLDGDGDLDLLVSTWDPAGAMKLFINNADGSFTERGDESGLAGITGGLNMVQGDYDNDGDVDVFVLRGAWLGAAGRHPNSLLRNRGDGTFEDVTFAAGLGETFFPTQTASWADYDNDGDLDLYIGNETTTDLVAPCELFRNNGDGTFTDVAIEAGVTNDRFTKAVVWGDYDGDRLPDLYVSNLGEPNRLFHNNGDGTFTDLAPEAGVSRPRASFPSWFWDVDSDGALDLFVAAYAADISHIAAALLGRPLQVELARLYRGDGHGRFADIAVEAGVAGPHSPMGSNFGDLDGDGFLDFYLGTGDPDYRNLMPNLMFLNQSGGRFANVTSAGGFGQLQKGHAVVFADFDHDGDLDVFQQLGGALAGDAFLDAFYENPGFGNHWLSVELVGTRSNRSAIGARIYLQFTDDGRVRSIHRWVSSGGSFGANPLRQTIGVGRSRRIDRLEVFWPTSRTTQVFQDLLVDRHVRIVETEDRVVELPRPPFALDDRP